MLEAAAEQYRVQQGISTTTASAASALWRRVDGEDFDGSWQRVQPSLLDIVERGRAAAVANALGYASAVLAETGQPDDPAGALAGESFLRSAPDGRGVGTLLDGALVSAKAGAARGLSADAALAQGGRWLTMATLTLLADTRREVYAADIVQRPSVTGYTRMLNPPSCARCIILAGKWYRWNEGFRRHPRCDCQHIPGAENVVGDERTDPYAAFRSMSAEQQEKVFGRLEARAIRDGADIYRVVNVQQRGLATARAAARYGTPSRMTIDDIYRVAGTRTNAIRLMEREGYILDRGQVAVERAPGVLTDAEVIAAGRGRGTVTIGGQTVTTRRAARYDAVVTGRRDPLNRSTMTAAERRLYDAHYRYAYTMRNGRVPRAIGPSSADVYAQPILATPAKLAELRRAYEVQLTSLSERSADGVRRVADALGIRVTNAGARSPLTSGAGSGGIEPPRRGGPPLPPPDPSDRDAWLRYWQNRQDALALDTGGDRLEPHEVLFLERFLTTNQVRWIPRDRQRRPTNDFVWVNRGEIEVELKSTTATYRAVRHHIHGAVTRAAAQGVVKENFIIDLGDTVLSEKLRNQLALFNQRTTSTPIRRLFVMSRDRFEEIPLA